jgi:hypothetical protein
MQTFFGMTGERVRSGIGHSLYNKNKKHKKERNKEMVK